MVVSKEIRCSIFLTQQFSDQILCRLLFFNSIFFLSISGDAKMTSNYGGFPDYEQLDSNNSQPDPFELLSAYIDGEVTPQERQQVQQWLDNDPEIKQLYRQLLTLQSGIQGLSVPSPPEISTTTLSENVFAAIDRNRNRKRLLLWGGGAIAATILATISGLLPGSNSPSLRLAESVKQETAKKPVLVAVTLNQPAIKIPKTAVSSSTPIEPEF